MITIRRASSVACAAALLALLAPTPGMAKHPKYLPTCAELGTQPYFGLAGHRDLSAVSSALVPAAGTSAAYCQVDIMVARLLMK